MTSCVADRELRTSALPPDVATYEFTASSDYSVPDPESWLVGVFNGVE